MKLFEIDYKRLIVLLLPTFLRKETTVTFLRIMTLPVVSLYNQFTTNRNANLYRLQNNGQVCYLRRLLNDAFPEANGKIQIKDGTATGNWLYAWDKDYDPYNYYLLIADSGTMFWNKDTILEGVSNFTVVVPASFAGKTNDIAKIISLVNEYKLLSKSYNIVYE